VSTASVFDSLIGQEQAVEVIKIALRAATSGARNQDMTHAWLFTGPPGSGRSNLAQAFAAALVCRAGGCGSCDSCRLAKSKNHPDIEHLEVAGTSIKIDEVRELISRTAFAPAVSDWRVIIVEDCDRMTEAASNALLKALEEPGERSVWLLCAPTQHDVLPTIRSRCRHIGLRTPTVSQISRYLVEELSADETTAMLAARISQGHIGRAKAFLTNPAFKSFRDKSFAILQEAVSESAAIRSARALLDLAEERATLSLSQIHEKDETDLRNALSNGSKGMVSGASKALKELERDQKARLNRAIRDEVDGALLDYASLFRDCLGDDEIVVNQDAMGAIRASRQRCTPEEIEALARTVGQTRESLMTNAAQILLLESFFLQVAALQNGKKHRSA